MGAGAEIQLSFSRLALGFAAAALLSACGEEAPASGPGFKYYAAEPTAARLVEVLDGKPDAKRRQLLVRALELHAIPYRRLAYTTPTGPSMNIEITHGSGAPVLIFATHYDRVGVAGGANDNASCVAAAIDAYRAVAAAGTPKRITLKVVFFDDEENGLKGSRHYAATAAQGTPNAIFGVVSLELCGIGDAFGIWDIDAGMEDSLIVRALRAAGKAEGVYFGIHGPVPRFSSDHASFLARGVPTVGLTVLPRADEVTLRAYVTDPNSLRWLFRWMRPSIFRTYHTAADGAATVQAAALAMVTRVIVRAVSEAEFLIGEEPPGKIPDKTRTNVMF